MNSFTTAIVLLVLALAQNDGAEASSSLARRLRTRPVYVSGNNKAATVSKEYDIAFGEEREIIRQLEESMPETKIGGSMPEGGVEGGEDGGEPSTNDEVEGGDAGVEGGEPGAMGPTSSATALGSSLCALLAVTGAVLML